MQKLNMNAFRCVTEQIELIEEKNSSCAAHFFGIAYINQEKKIILLRLL